METLQAVPNPTKEDFDDALAVLDELARHCEAWATATGFFVPKAPPAPFPGISKMFIPSLAQLKYDADRVGWTIGYGQSKQGLLTGSITLAEFILTENSRQLLFEIWEWGAYDWPPMLGFKRFLQAYLGIPRSRKKIREDYIVVQRYAREALQEVEPECGDPLDWCEYEARGWLEAPRSCRGKRHWGKERYKS